jgi:hypothetical protein
MADTKISDLTAITGSALASGDLFAVVDVSDTSMAASGTNKKITKAELDSVYATSAAITSAVSAHESDTTSVHGIADTSALVTTTSLATSLGSYVPLAQSVNAQTGTSYTLVAGDAGKLVTLSNASAITLTVPQDSDATIAVGTYVDLYQLGAGQVTVAAGTGATLRTSGLTAKARAQYSRLGVQKVSANTWSLFGDLAAS